MNRRKKAVRHRVDITESGPVKVNQKMAFFWVIQMLGRFDIRFEPDFENPSFETLKNRVLSISS